MNRDSVVAQIDTMFTGTMLIYPNAIERLALTREAGSTALEHFPFTDGGVNLHESFAQESFSDKQLGLQQSLYFPTPDVHTPNGFFDATVGLGLLKDHVVTFDFSRGHFLLNVISPFQS